MIVANPTFDPVFKYLMEDIVVAKGLISRIIEKEIIELTPAPQESSQIKLYLKYAQIGLMHQDYVAIIKNDKGEHEKIIVEFQKTYVQPKIEIFRNYLADKYSKKSVINGKEVDLPITTIYLIEETFNKNLPPVLKVANEYIDVLNHAKYKGVEDKTVSLLTHEAYFIQTELVPPDLQNELTRVLNFFTRMFQFKKLKNKQLTRYEKNKLARELDVPEAVIDMINDKLFQRMLTRLLAGSKDRQTQLNVELSQRWQDKRAEEEKRILRAIEQKDEIIVLKEKELQQKKQALQEKDQELGLKDFEIGQKEQALQEKDQELGLKDFEIGQKEQAIQEKEQAIQKKDQTIQKKDQTIQEKEQELGQKNQILQEKDQAIQEKEQALKQAKQVVLNYAQHLKNTGQSTQEIQQATGLSIEEIENLK